MEPFVLSEDALVLFVQQYLLVLFRIAAMLMVMPVIGSRLVTARLKVVLAFTITLLILPFLPSIEPIKDLSIQTFMIVFQEILLGVMVGFSFQIIFQVFVLAGQIIAMKMGLGFASMNDPVNGVNTTALSQFYQMLVTLMFVSVDGHLMLIRLVVDSFETFVPGQFYVSSTMVWQYLQLASYMFAASLLMALPVMTSLLFVNLTFGVMSRAAPQLNIFSIGFPFTLISGLLLVWLGLGSFLEKFEDIMEFGFLFLNNFLTL